jgi:hypothetical protein
MSGEYSKFTEYEDYYETLDQDGDDGARHLHPNEERDAHVNGFLKRVIRISWLSHDWFLSWSHF